MHKSHDLSAGPTSEPVYVPSSSQELPSSPPSIASDAGFRHKPKRPPPVTPRSFKRFFTPRSMLNKTNAGSVKTNRQALKVLSSPAVNRLGPAFTKTSRLGENQSVHRVSEDIVRTPSRKRKLSFSSDASPLQSSPLRKARPRSPVGGEREVEGQTRNSDGGCEIANGDGKLDSTEKHAPARPVRRSRALQTSGSIYMRSVSGPQRDRVTVRSNSGTGWQDLTSSFYSRPEDSYSCLDLTGSRLTPPFCTASCNTNSLVAVGDEEGGVRLLDSAKEDKRGFSHAYLTFQPHMNSIMDLEFSSDDMLLATASGDQSSMVMDMATQKPVYCLSNHFSSVKRVQFQPASGNKVLATCGRDGIVNMWDLRCRGVEKPSLQVRCSLESDSGQVTTPTPFRVTYPHVLNTIHGAHAWVPPQGATHEKKEPPMSRSDITVTSLAFLPPGRENLFVTASEANACVRLWDLRTAHNNRCGRPVVPLSTTRQPDSHRNYRGFGLTSVILGGDGSRLYTLCRDGTVYAYSAPHLILGHAPELSTNYTRPRRSGGSEKEGLGPLYGFRHPRLKVSTFYVKLALRKPSQDKPEMLAVGNSDSCPILFPADEKFLPAPTPASASASASASEQQQKPTAEADPRDQRPRTRLFTTTSQHHSQQHLRRSNSAVTSGPSGRLEDTIPIYQSGTPLVGAHRKEVSAVSWTVDGELVTVSDDFTARCWREGPQARDLRTGGETEGRRWRCGWAETPDAYDDEDE